MLNFKQEPNRKIPNLQKFTPKATTSIFTLPFRIDSLNFLLKILSLKQTAKAPENRRCMHFQGVLLLVVGGGGFSFGGTVQYIEESNIYLCFVVCRLKRGLVT